MAVRFADAAAAASDNNATADRYSLFGGSVTSALSAKDRELLQLRRSRRRHADVDERQRAQILYADALSELLRPRTCFYCSRGYSDAVALGRRQCRWHPGAPRAMGWTSDTEASAQRWSCCSQRIGTTFGCRRCDHTDAPYDRTGFSNTRVTLPAALRSWLLCDDDAVVQRGDRISVERNPTVTLSL
jgi:hypothetical protein